MRWGGSGYFRTRVVQSYLEQGVLQRDTSAPEFSYPVYLVFSRERASDQLYELFDVLREQVVQLDEWQP